MNHGQDVNVYLTSLTPAVENDILNGQPSASVHFVRTPNSMRDLQALQTTIASQLSYWADQGVKITTWGPDVWTGKEAVTVYNLTSGATTALNNAYGATKLLIENSPTTYVAQAATTRQNDQQPWNGGDFMEGPDQYKAGYVSDCTRAVRLALRGGLVTEFWRDIRR